MQHKAEGEKEGCHDVHRTNKKILDLCTTIGLFGLFFQMNSPVMSWPFQRDF